MGRHSRRGSAPQGDATGTGGRRRGAGAEPGQGVSGAPRSTDGVPGRAADGTPGPGGPRFDGRASAAGGPRLTDGTPAHGFPRLPDGTPAHGTPAHGTPAHGTPVYGASAHGTASARGGHPEQYETGGGWGELRGRGTGGASGAAGQGAPGGPGGSGGPGIPRQRPTRPASAAGAGPRQDYVDAFDGDDEGFDPPHGARSGSGAGRAGDPYASVTRWETQTDTQVGLLIDARDGDDGPPGSTAPERGRDGKGGKGRTFTGIAALAVTTVLAVVVAGQVRAGDDPSVPAKPAADQARDTRDPASRGDGRPTPTESPSVVPLTYDQKMAKLYPLSETLAGSGEFEAVEGVDRAPGDGDKYTYRVDVEEGLGLDADLFAEAVQKTLNDERSWAHGGGRTFERVHSGSPDFVITLASPGTTGEWCAMSGLDTTIDNVSCDSASTERVMINAYRWAQGSETYGDHKIHAYRQMLINHEVGHRLGYTHVTCDADGDLAPVMQQQTKFLEYDGVSCRANAWPYPGGSGSSGDAGN
ncbi:DUF3152 domain-containing protein [Streptomyces sp. NPDC091377]|uniref:DUF3152 domain-containing protein n=1 Tax=Streptomyces sp. NPDC091377 TaxID=3365995 RepID=UPI00382984BB